MTGRGPTAGRLAGLLLCGIALTPAGAIVGPGRDGGALAPFVIMVLNRTARTAGYCSALVVARQAVLTAAHCVPDGAAVKVHYRDAANRPVLLDVAAIARHPGYRPDAIRTRQRSIDLALLRLAEPLPERFQPARRAAVSAAAPGTGFRLTGFGLSHEGDPSTAGVLRVADVVAHPPVSAILLWALDPSGRGAGACTGDSGGPVFAATEDAAVALTAWSAGTGSAVCGLLTQAVWLGPQAPWIDATLGAWGFPTGG